MMDPFSLFALGGAAALALRAVHHQVTSSSAPPLRIRTAWRDPSGEWEATEVLSSSALQEAGQILDVAVTPWETAAATGLARVLVLTRHKTQEGALLRLFRDGATWRIDVAFGPHGNRVGPLWMTIAEQALRTLNTRDQTSVFQDIDVWRGPDGTRVLRIADPLGTVSAGIELGVDLESWSTPHLTSGSARHLYKVVDPTGWPMGALIAEEKRDGRLVEVAKIAPNEEESALSSVVQGFLGSTEPRSPSPGRAMLEELTSALR